MSWLAINFCPGFAPDQTSWHTEVERDGRLRQFVRIHRFEPYEQRNEHHEAVLTSAQICDLERLVGAIDFLAINAVSRSITVDDAERIQITVEGTPVKSISGPLLYWHQMQAHDQTLFCPALVHAIKLWDSIDRLSIHKLGTAAS